ncbi:uncharacterized protein LOC132281035 [Cornus florida]|uniref:uncharacterized protein LOC132281035 n=1 Tax=Cornus florida TaxID=4283 RepID=UPI0028978152|nr:uncharacterized protein LOC132281035 [Cornus florida]
MDFVVGLPRSIHNHDTVWVIVDRLTKSAHFLPIRATDTVKELCKIYIRDIVKLHGVPVSIVSNRDPRFSSQFWSSFHAAFGTPLSLSTAFHPQTDGQSERVIQFVGPKLVQETTEKVAIIRDRLRTAQSRQKSYANRRRRALEFSVGDLVFLKVSPMKGVTRFGKKEGKLAPRFIGSFEITERIREVAYRLALPPRLSVIHDVFHVSMLRRCLRDETQVVDCTEVQLRPNVTYVETPVRIVDSIVKQ